MSLRAYSRDLAYVHNVGFGSFAEQSAPGVLNILRCRGSSRGLVIDLGCGGGLWARRLVDAGYGVLGIDISPHMIAMARQRVPEATFRTCSSFIKGRNWEATCARSGFECERSEATEIFGSQRLTSD